MKACKHNKEIEIVTKTMRTNLQAPNQGGPPTKLPLKVMHLKQSPISLERIYLKAPNFSRHVRAHTYIKNRSGFWYLYSFGSMGVNTFPNQNKYICKIRIINSIKAKILQGGPYVHNVYKCTHEHTLNHVCEHDEHVYAVYGMHA